MDEVDADPVCFIRFLMLAMVIQEQPSNAEDILVMPEDHGETT